MVTLFKSEVPEYLRNGDFYQSLSDDNDDPFTINREQFRPPGPINSMEDLEHLLTTLRFWGTDIVPAELLDYVWDKEVSEYEPLFAQYWDELTFLRKVVRLMYTNEDYRMNTAIGMDDVVIVQYLLGRGCKFNKASSRIAASTGNTDIFLLIDAQNKTIPEEALRVVQMHGHSKMVDFLLRESMTSMEFCDICCVAAEHGHVNCLHTLLQQRNLESKDLFQSVIVVAIHYKQLACLVYLADINKFTIEWRDLLWIARGCGDLDCLKFVYTKAGSAWDSHPPRLDVSASNSIECVKFAVETGCVLHPTTIYSAAARGNVEVVKYLHEKGYFLDPEYASIAAHGNHTDVLRYMAEQLGTLPYYVYLEAASKGHIECLKIAHQYGTNLPWDAHVCFRAAAHGHLDCLKYLHERGCPWDFLTTEVLIYNKDTEGLQYAVENGCPIRWQNRLRIWLKGSTF